MILNFNLHTSAVKVKIGMVQKTVTSPPPPTRLVGFILMSYFSQINNSKIPFHLLVNQKGLHQKYVKYISFSLAEKISEYLHIPSNFPMVV